MLSTGLVHYSAHDFLAMIIATTAVVRVVCSLLRITGLCSSEDCRQQPGLKSRMMTELNSPCGIHLVTVFFSVTCVSQYTLNILNTFCVVVF